MSLTSPLGLMRHVRRPNLRLDVVPWLNVLLLGWLLTLLSSSYIFAPGLAVGLGSPPSLPANLALPQTAGQPALLHIDTALTILLPYYYLDDGRHYKADLPKALNDFVKRTKRPHLVLLVKMSSDVPIQIYADVCKMARDAGFETVQLAEIPVPGQDDSTPAAPTTTNSPKP
jgi:biopolymer transport protein ExbD